MERKAVANTTAVRVAATAHRRSRPTGPEPDESCRGTEVRGTREPSATRPGAFFRSGYAVRLFFSGLSMHGRFRAAARTDTPDREAHFTSRRARGGAERSKITYLRNASDNSVNERNKNGAEQQFDLLVGFRFPRTRVRVRDLENYHASSGSARRQATLQADPQGVGSSYAPRRA